MSTNDRPSITFEIPSNWTVEQAEAVYRFLSCLAEAVFEAYDKPLCLLAQHQCEIFDDEDLDNEAFDNDIPF